MSVLKPNQSQNFNGKSGDEIQVTNQGGGQGNFEFNYENSPNQSHTIGGLATQNFPVSEWPVGVTNTGSTTLDVSVVFA